MHFLIVLEQMGPSTIFNFVCIFLQMIRWECAGSNGREPAHFMCEQNLSVQVPPVLVSEFETRVKPEGETYCGYCRKMASILCNLPSVVF